jgi:cyclohexanecarboxylate-CoA ligase
MWETLVRPAPEQAASFRASGQWRSETVLHDLQRAAQANPDKPAIVSYAAGRPARTVSYREYLLLVDRFAAALLELGVQRRDVVAVHLPNWWMLGPLYLACARVGAVPAPVMPTLGPRELAHVLTSSGAKVCLIPDSYQGMDYLFCPDRLVTRLAGVAPPRAVWPRW